MKNEKLEMMAAIIAAGVIQSHGSSTEQVARTSIALAREISKQVEEATPAEPAPEPEPELDPLAPPPTD